MMKTMIAAMLLVGQVWSAEPRTLTLNATAAVQKTADAIQMTLGVITLNEQAEEALQENSAKMEEIIHQLQLAGLEKGEYQTGHFAITPTYTPYPLNPPANWKQSINGYQASHSIVIRTAKIELAGKFVDVANRAGANDINNISFCLQNPRAHWQEAIVAATRNGVEDAEAMAAAAGVRLAKVLSIQLTSTDMSAPAIHAKQLCGMANGGSAPSPRSGSREDQRERISRLRNRLT